MACAMRMGTTSACAENTTPASTGSTTGRNYLRVRGEYRRRPGCVSKALELPPRARRILADNLDDGSFHGTTSACAENTLIHCQAHITKRNYLRVRGEYLLECLLDLAEVELPPRARRIPTVLHRGRLCKGTTSACAENTS